MLKDNQYYAGVVRKKFTLLCEAPDGAQVHILDCYDENAVKAAQLASQKILDLMKESFEMEDGFCMRVETSMEAANDVPLVEAKDGSRLSSG